MVSPSASDNMPPSDLHSRLLHVEVSKSIFNLSCLLLRSFDKQAVICRNMMYKVLDC